MMRQQRPDNPVAEPGAVLLNDSSSRSPLNNFWEGELNEELNMQLAEITCHSNLIKGTFCWRWNSFGRTAY